MEHRHYLKDGTEYVKATDYYQLLKEIKADKKASYEEKNRSRTYSINGYGYGNNSFRCNKSNNQNI